MIARIEKSRGEKVSDAEKEELVKKFSLRGWDQFVLSLGAGDVSLHSVQNFFGLSDKKAEKKPSLSTAPIGVSIQGMENLLVNYAKCCKPLPGDDIIGFVTRGRGSSSIEATARTSSRRRKTSTVPSMSHGRRSRIHFSWPPSGWRHRTGEASFQMSPPRSPVSTAMSAPRASPRRTISPSTISMSM